MISHAVSTIDYEKSEITIRKDGKKDGNEINGFSF